MAVRATSTVARKVALTGGALAAIVVLAFVGLTLAGSGRTEACTVTASSGGTVRSTPEAAFDAWWDVHFPDGPEQDDADVDRDGTTWLVAEGEGPGRWRKVEVDHPVQIQTETHLGSADPAGLGRAGWVVVADNACTDD